MGRTITLAGGTALAFAAIAVAGPGLSAERLHVFKAEMQAYYDCNIRAAKTVATQEGDPLSLATAVRGFCKKEEAALAQGISRAFPDPRRSNELLSHARSLQLESNASIIVRERMKKPQR